MKYYKGEPGVIYPPGGKFLVSADSREEAEILLQDVYLPILDDLRTLEELSGYTGNITLGIAPAPVSRSSGGGWTVRMWKDEEDFS